MGQKRHIMHGRDHLPGGADPIPGLAGSYDYAVVTRTTATTLDGSTTPRTYNADDYPTWTGSSYYGDSFSGYTDGNGVVGISISEANAFVLGYVYTLIEPADVGSSNPGRLIPPDIRIRVDTVNNNSSDFGSSGAAPIDGQAAEWHRSGEEAVPAADTYGRPGYLFLASSFWDYVADAATFKAWTVRVMSSGGAHQWKYYSTSLKLTHIGTRSEP